MKSILASVLLLIVVSANAQIVNIPDPNFKRILVDDATVTGASGLTYTGVDVNNNGEVEVSEALAVYKLRYSGNTVQINNFSGLGAFLNLQEFVFFDITSNNGKIIFTGLPNLKTVRFANLINLSIDARNCPQIELLSVDYENSITQDSVSIDVRNSPKLKNFRVVSTGRVTVKGFEDSHQLQTLLLSCNDHWPKLDLTACDSLSSLGVGGASNGSNFVDTLVISGLKKLLGVSLRSIKVFIARNNTGIENIYLIGTDQIDLQGCSNLKRLDIRNIYDTSSLRAVDLSSCYRLQDLYIIDYFSILRYLNLKNGSILRTCNVFQGADLGTLNICADEFEVDTLHTSLANSIPTASYGRANINPYCSFFPGGIYNTIKGKARLDLQANGCDSTDRGIGNVAQLITDTSGNRIVRYTAPSGDYAHYPYKGLFTIRPYFPYPYFNIGPASAQAAFDTANSLTSINNFCITPNGVHNDLEINFLPVWQFARPGFPAAYQLSFTNRGNTTLSGQTQLLYSRDKMDFTSASAAPFLNNPGELIWNYNNLAPLETRRISVNFMLLPPPTNNSGDTIYYMAAINPIVNDEQPDDNRFVLPQRVTGSYDPNDKQCLQGSNLDVSNIDKPLDYLIRFQNLGTDTAFNVVIADTLSSKLDPTSVTVTGSSHPCSVRQKNNQLEFIFENIQLPHKAVNEPASNGFVAFKVKPKGTIAVGDTLNNTASIYFDFNAPVVTNTAQVVVRAANPSITQFEYFTAIKQGTVSVLQWKVNTNSAFVWFEIERSGDGVTFTKIETVGATADLCRSPFRLEDTQPLSGKNFYRIKMTTIQTDIVYSNIIQLGNEGLSLDITAITGETYPIVNINNIKPQQIDIGCFSMEGKSLYHSTIQAQQGNVQITIPVYFPKGIYVLQLQAADGTRVTKKFVR